MNLHKLKRSKNLVCALTAKSGGYKVQGFVLDYSDEIVLLQYVCEFRLDGYLFLCRSDITDVFSRKTDLLQTQILKEERVYSNVNFDAPFKLDGWESVFRHCHEQNEFVAIDEDRTEDGRSTIGEVHSINPGNVSVLGFSGAANWDEYETVHHFKDITCVQVGGHYMNMYKRHFGRHL